MEEGEGQRICVCEISKEKKIEYRLGEEDEETREIVFEQQQGMRPNVCGVDHVFYTHSSLFLSSSFNGDRKLQLGA